MAYSGELAEASYRESERQSRVWGAELFAVPCMDYVVRHQGVLLQDCVGMSDAGKLEVKQAVMDKYHSLVREFRIGMMAVVTENGVSRGRQTTRNEEAGGSVTKPQWPGFVVQWPEELAQVQSGSSGALSKSAPAPRLLNGGRG